MHTRGGQRQEVTSLAPDWARGKRWRVPEQDTEHGLLWPLWRTHTHITAYTCFCTPYILKHTEWKPYKKTLSSRMKWNLGPGESGFLYSPGSQFTHAVSFRPPIPSIGSFLSMIEGLSKILSTRVYNLYMGTCMHVHSYTSPVGLWTPSDYMTMLTRNSIFWTSLLSLLGSPRDSRFFFLIV